MDVWLSQSPTCPFCKQTVEVPSEDHVKAAAARLGASVARVRNLPRWLRRNSTSSLGSASNTGASPADLVPPDPHRPTARASRNGAVGRLTENIPAGGAVAAAEEGRRSSTLPAPFGGFVGEAPGLSAAELRGRGNNSNNSEGVANVEMMGFRRGGLQRSPGDGRNMSTE